MTRRLSTSGAALLACLVSNFVMPSLAVSQVPEGFEARLDRALAALPPNTPFNGILIVGDASDRHYEHVAGFANFEHRIPIGLDTRFRIASVSKQFAGALAAMLEADGRVDVRAPVSALIPELSGFPAGDATLDVLLRHRSGLSMNSGYMWDHVIHRYAWDWQANVSRDGFTQDSFLAAMRGEEQQSPPDSAYQYCNECYLMTGIALAAAGGAESYEQLLEDRVLGPLGMADTGFDGLDLFLPGRAYAYEYRNGGPSPITRWRNLARIGPAGGMYSTIGDLETWARAIFYPGPLLTDEARARFLPTANGYHYGLTRETRNVGGGNTVDVIHHTGQIAGTFAWIAYLPSRSIHVILLSNIGFTLPQQQLMASVLAALRGD